MEKKDPKIRVQERSAEYKQEEERLLDLLSFADDVKLDLIQQLIKEAAFIAVENNYLREVMAEVGMVRIHPQDPGLQKPLETTKQYRQNVNTYAVIIKTINSITGSGLDEEDDGFDKWLAERREKKEQQNRS